MYKKFCPGPITFVLSKKNKSKIQSSVTANLGTVAIRFPSHNTTRSILKKLNFPLAMPSANLSSGISPVNASDVADEFKKKIKIIIDGGNSKIGIESTVVNLIGKPKILRPGIIGTKTINDLIEEEEKLLNANVNYLNSKKDFLLNYFKIKSLDGSLIKMFENYLPQIN